MIRTLLIGNHLSTAGDSPKVCEELAERLRGAGWPVETASSRRTPVVRLADMVWAAGSRPCDVAQIDVYSGRAFLWAEAAAGALRARRKPYVLTLHGGNLPVFARRHPRRTARLLRSAAAVTAPSSYLQRAFGDVRDDVVQLPNAVDLPRYPYRRRERPGPRLLWLRAFHQIYDSILAIETLADLRRDFPDVRLTMAGPDRGDGSLEASRRRSAALGVSGRVRIAGRVDKAAVPDWLNGADVFVNTSRTDNFPVSLVEAMACGLCIVTTNVGGIPDLLEDGVDALLVPPGDPAAMAAAVRRVLREPGLAARLSGNARRKAEAFDWSAILPAWRQLLARAAEGAGRPV